MSSLILNDEQFRILAKYIHREFGIFLNDQKKTLLQSRLSSLLNKRAMSVQQYIQLVVNNPNPRPEDVKELASQISTNHTYFNREPAHYNIVTSEVLPWVRARAERTGRKELRMWCAAASTGEEPYSLAMLQLDYFKAEIERWDAGLLATDLSNQALEIAKQGVYSSKSMEGLPPHWRHAYFKPLSNGAMEVLPVLRKQVMYRRFNLMSDFPFKKPFDVIFCRNVLIYFDVKTKQALTEKFSRWLNPGGYLFLGMSEALDDPRNLFSSIHTAVYCRRE